MNEKLAFAQKTRGLTNDEYRDIYRLEKLPSSYRHWLHLGFNLGSLGIVFLGNLVLIKKFQLSLIALFVLVMLIGNFAVYCIHRFPLHRRMKFWTFPFDSHTVEHHRFFTSDHITFKNSKDYYAIFFPSFVVAIFVFAIFPLFFYGSSFFLTIDQAHFFTSMSAGYFLLYEFVHWASHLQEDHFLMKLNWLKMMREHHRVHHNPKLMGKYNFTIVYPLMDILMGTKYKGILPADLAEDHAQNVEQNFRSLIETESLLHKKS
ncbi:MAG: hypothetical protein COW00_14400 [Bdellovibrio sp. CG12_big_fil_rev_8_21_14_0_65_39_13]|nr:MAG: hypothetical protein COW78_07855 [Bdellovibrio sp. CG22_combo_CG10-13_8_21_14_all_39_27]PIQ58804.1 MAG: hypothetical protein COW00_14400 [Bdellovibrio sp. CG12_big_fil_rev_8_21_14_0_65_39_13]PIR35515.1 MAG: hypothetical protein COV37_08550 [Bdellovibrio sp. CG11_big_fil_rev_8_21_14_0_20_39_38]PJB54352.1 MAG: hypothetical protein CO099_02055 [Bdellovibrio sp. CG_4_9_14_3_um_filter_39_7]